MKKDIENQCMMRLLTEMMKITEAMKATIVQQMILITKIV